MPKPEIDLEKLICKLKQRGVDVIEVEQYLTLVISSNVSKPLQEAQ
ncbi:hypothetical protein J41TS12_39560 [Paenibacillus antibioticophila]|uniref:Uncharacterized protein n=1 Tax=Paenibacillus antibioticophila TaxID=1274374 RepID=A0A919XZA3_9BACL|nr:hypothetical protein J41TS12_39560 [Paenibacillus antibioticophila]